MSNPARYGQVRQLVDPSAEEGKNYIILNANSVNSTGDNELKIALLKGNRLGLTKGKGDEGEEYLKKTFKIQPCSDNNGADFVATLYNSPNYQWVLARSGNAVEVRKYPNLGAGGEEDPERLRPPQNRWRFAFERSGPGSKLYRIICLDDALVRRGTTCLCLIGSPNQNGEFQLGFSIKNGNDKNQLWCFEEV